MAAAINVLNGNVNDDIRVNSFINGESFPNNDNLENSSVIAVKTVDERIKRKAKRPSKNVSIDAAGIQNGHAPLNGSLLRMYKNGRKPRNGFGRGLPKKGGAGGKGTWGKLGSELEPPEDDVHDPNYDSDSQDNLKFERIIPTLPEEDFEREVEPILREYFENGDPQEVELTVEELNLGPALRPQIVSLAVTLALERKPSHREMTSVLLAHLCDRILDPEDVAKGFKSLMLALPDLVLDTPEAPVALGNFLARAVADDCLPPRFVEDYLDKLYQDTDAPSKEEADSKASYQPLAREALEHALKLLRMRHGLVRLDNVWGVGGGIVPVKCLIRQIRLLLQEYLSSGDIAEATRCLQDLEVPHFHHELVYEALVMTLEDTRVKTMELMTKFLAALSTSVIVTIDQLKHGFYRVYEEMPDISLDVPAAYVLLEKFVSMCHAAGFLPTELLKTIPARGRKRFVSEGDGGRIKEDETR